jgi:hypothetical protein
MRQHTLTICESRPIGNLHWVAFTAPQLAAHWQPGQFLQIVCDENGRHQRFLLRATFPVQVDMRLGRIGIAIPTQADEGWAWLARQPIDSPIICYGPQGKLPEPIAERGTALCIGQGEAGLRLLGIVNALNQRTVNTTFIVGDMQPPWHIPTQLVPGDVEYLAGSESVLRIAEKRLPELLRWADTIYVAATLPVIQTIRQHLRQTRLRAGRSITFVQVTGQLPCASQSCQQCRVQTRHGPRLACQTGPWYAVHELL